jgi:arylsulfatase A-like enzyme
VTVPENGVFSTELAIVAPAPPVTFGVAVSADGETVTLARTPVTSDSDWNELRCDLSAFSGREVTVTLTAECKPPGNVALSANPILYEPQNPALRTSTPPARGADRRPPNVLLYLIDALRADHLEAYGYHRETAPTIAALARQGVRFERFYAQDTWTKPSVSSLLAGVPQLVHGAQHYGETVPGALTLLPELLRAHGYATGAVTENNHVGPITRLERGLSRLDTAQFEPHKTWFMPVNTFELVKGFLEEHTDRPFFLYVHTIEPHEPYFPPEPYAGRFVPEGEEPSPIDLYDGEIARADAKLAQVLVVVRELGLEDDTLLLVISDHGEAFGEHEGMTGHGGKPYNELIHIPLVAHCPSLVPGGSVVEHPTQLLDLAPTICDVVGIDPPEQFQGTSLWPLIMGARDVHFPERTIFSVGRGTLSAVRGSSKLMAEPGTGTVKNPRLYDLAADPGETTDLAGEQRRTAKRLGRVVVDYMERQQKLAAEVRSRERDAARRLHVDPEAVERLRALGYVK